MILNSEQKYKPEIIAFWNFKLDYFFDKPTKIFIDCIDGCGKNNLNTHDNILVLFEPDEISKIKDGVIKNKNNFNLILTHNETILKNCENSILHEYGTTWIETMDFYKNKSFSVSFLAGYKNYATGHIMRKELWDLQEKINISKRFFISKYGGVKNLGNNMVLGDSKLPLFKSQFHIVIENTKNKYFFTEKLIDCFITKTIPLYWGCTNIGDYFNENGILLVNNVEDIINTCNNLNENIYNEKIYYINENYERSKKFLDQHEMLSNKLNNLNFKNHKYETVN